MQGVSSKLDAYPAILRDAGLTDAAVAYMGDDLIDLPVLARAGLSAAPADAAPEVRSRVDWVSAGPGGRGAVREFIEMVLRAQESLGRNRARIHARRLMGPYLTLFVLSRCSPVSPSARPGSATSSRTAAGSIGAARGSLRITCSGSTSSSPTRSIPRLRN